MSGSSGSESLTSQALRFSPTPSSRVCRASSQNWEEGANALACKHLGRFYKLVLMEGSVSILLGCVGITSASRTVSFCFSFGHVARYAPSRKAKTYGTIAESHHKLIYRTYLYRDAFALSGRKSGG